MIGPKTRLLIVALATVVLAVLVAVSASVSIVLCGFLAWLAMWAFSYITFGFMIAGEGGATDEMVEKAALIAYAHEGSWHQSKDGLYLWKPYGDPRVLALFALGRIDHKEMVLALRVPNEKESG